MALEDDNGRWFLINASPDLARQIEQFSPLQPRPTPPRNSPIAGVLLTNADLDHVLGLFSVREGGRMNVYASEPVRAAVADTLGLAAVFDRFCGATWRGLVFGEFRVLNAEAEPNEGLLYRAIALPGKPPPYVAAVASLPAGPRSVAYQFLNPRTGRRLLVAPDVAACTPGLQEALETSDIILFDGTFWSPDELGQIKPNARTAEAMGHLPIRDGSLKLLARASAKTKAYIHINNTNPILAASSPQRAQVEAAGLVVGADGMEFDL